MKLAVVHQLPLEYYPPVTNAIRYFADRESSQVLAVSSANQKGRVPFADDRVPTERPPLSLASQSAVARLWNATQWHRRTAALLARWKPDVVLYYEPHSALAVFLCQLVHRGTAAVFVHHHEYYEPGDYRAKGNRLTRLNHFFERHWLFRRASWVSQTNSERLRLFRRDNPHVAESKLRVLPNYPPADWSGSHGPQAPSADRVPLQLAYVGSVSLHDTYIGELVRWIRSRSCGDVTLDVFAYNCDPKTAAFLREHQCERVRFHEQGLDYDAIPPLLREFHVGVVLYRCSTTNFKFNASNKLFEYLACGLDVWFPPTMLGVRPYAREDCFPRVMEVDFENLEALDLTKMRSRDGLPPSPPPPSCESEFEKLRREMELAVHGRR